jgi:deoxyribonuclease IV
MFGPHVDRTHVAGRRPPLAAHAAAALAAVPPALGRACQVFVTGPRNSRTTLLPEEAEGLRRLASAGCEVIVHGAYPNYPWKKDEASLELLKRELGLAASSGARGLVVHLGVPGPEQVLDAAPHLMHPGAPLIYLETPHVLPQNSHYETPEKLGALFALLRGVDPGLRHFGCCIDTAHLWACGVDLATREAGEDWINRLEAQAEVLPPDRVIFHLNDSRSARGSGLDQHAPLLKGEIWGDYADRPRESGLAAFVAYAKKHGSVAILERKPRQALPDDYAVIAELLA